MFKWISNRSDGIAMRFSFWLLLVFFVSLSAFSKEPDIYSQFNKFQYTHLPENTDTEIYIDGKTIRALFIAPRFTISDALEVSMRLRIEADYIPVWDSLHLGHDSSIPEHNIPGTSMEDIDALLRKVLKKEHDLIVIGNIDSGILPVNIIDILADKVVNGAGLFISNYGHNSILSHQAFKEISISEIPPAIYRCINRSKFKSISCYAFGKGNVIKIDWPGIPSQTHFLLDNAVDIHNRLDSCFSVPLQLLRWVAGCQPKLFIEGIEYAGPKLPDESEIPPDLRLEDIQGMLDSSAGSSARPYTIRFNTSTNENYTVELRLCRDDAKLRTIAQTVAVPKGQDTCLAYIPVGAGKYLLDVNLFDKKQRLVDWYTEAMEVKGWPEFSNIRFSKIFLLPNDTLSITAKVRALLLGRRPFTLYIRATDSFDRLVAEKYKTYPGETESFQAQLSFSDLISGHVRVEVFAVDKTGENFDDVTLMASAMAAVNLPVRLPSQSDDFSFAITGDMPEEHNVWEYNRLFVENGVDTYYTRANAGVALRLAEGNLRPLLKLAQVSSNSAQDGTIRKPCLTDPQHIDLENTKLKGKSEALWAFGSNLYSLGSGNCIVKSDENVCQSMTCLNMFRDKLKLEYGTIENLNEGWNSTYEMWDGILPSSREEAIISGNYASWIDFRRYMDSTFTGFHKQEIDTIRTVNRDAKTGFRALDQPGINSGYNWALLAPELGVIGVGPEALRVEKVRSFKLQDAYAGVCFGGDTSPFTLEHYRWYPWYSALHDMSSAWMDVSHGGSKLDSPFVALSPDGRPSPTFTATANEIKILKAGIGKLLMNSKRINSGIAIYDSPSTKYLDQLNTNSNMQRSQKLCIDVLEELGYQYDFISSVDVEKGRLSEYKLLLMPEVRALSRKENMAIEEYGRSGRILVIGQSQNYYDEHGFPASNPVWLDTSNSEDDNVIQKLKEICDEIGIKRIIDFSMRKQEEFNGELIGYQYDKAKIVAILSDPDSPDRLSKLILNFPNDKYVYDMLATTRSQGTGAVRNSRKVAVRLARGNVAIYASLPYEISDLVLQAPRIAVAGRRLPLSILLKAKDKIIPGEHIVHIEIAPIDSNAPIDYYSRNIVCKKGKGQTYIPLALNDRAGKYTVSALDVLTGLKAQSIIEVVEK